MTDEPNHPARLLAVWGTLMDRDYEWCGRNPLAVIEMIDAIRGSIQWAEKSGVELETVTRLHEFRSEAIGALVDRLITKSEDSIDKAADGRPKIKRIEAAIAGFRSLSASYGETEEITREIANFHSQWLEESFAKLIADADSFMRSGEFAKAAEACDEARAFVDKNGYPHESDRQLHMDEIAATIESIEDRKKRETDPPKKKRRRSSRQSTAKAKSEPAKAAPSTERQRAYANDLGISYPPDISCADLSGLIDARLESKNKPAAELPQTSAKRNSSGGCLGVLLIVAAFALGFAAAIR